jgi:preprotein translocase subunit SecE|tara:strand:- start:291 stop:716 length:426 start_codon:yes stop_codon:yes gene_type:complete
MKANNAETPDSSNFADIFKWVVTFALLAAAVVGNYLYGVYSDPGLYPDSLFTGAGSLVIRVAGVVILIAAALGVAATTRKGKAAIEFAKESRMEVRKVVWPTRQETMQTTLIVLAVSIVMALILYGIDSIMYHIVNFVTGV